MYDWANSAFVTTIVAAVFPIYFQDVAAAGLPGSVATERYAMATTIALVLIAVSAPVLGALADYAGVKKKFLGAFLTLGVVSTAAMYFIQRSQWLFAAAVFVVSNIGLSGTFVFYDSLLPHVARGDELDRVSTAGYALGYLGGGLLLAVNLAWIQFPSFFGIADAAAASRLSFLSVAIWWALFSLPLLLRVPEPQRRLEAGESSAANPVRMAFFRLGRTLREVRHYRQAALLLLAVLIYNDGIVTIIRMAAIYGREIGLPQSALIGAILMVQFVGVPCAFLFGSLASRIGAKRAVLLGLSVYVAISILGYVMTTAWQFYLLAFLVAVVQGGTQALGRSLFASMVPRHRSSEFFGFFGVFERFSAILGPAVFAGLTALTGSSRPAILSVIVFFAVGAVLLIRVDVPAGQRIARQAEVQP